MKIFGLLRDKKNVYSNKKRISFDRNYCITWESNWDGNDELSDTERSYQSEKGDLLRDTEEKLTVTVEFIDENVETITKSVSITEVVAENI